jgi:DNA-binding FadR family transcriptional regulator
MTRQQKNSAQRFSSSSQSVLGRVHPVRKLSEQVIAQLRDEIGEGRLCPGMRLPTEQDMMTAMGVSRTVVREAVAALRAEGLVTTRQGAGAFVAADPAKRGFRIEAGEADTLDNVLFILELRFAIEVEAAALAAQRASTAGVRMIAKALKAFERAVARGEQAVEEDFAFHRAVAAASQNRYFDDLLQFLGHFIIPRHALRFVAGSPDAQKSYLLLILREHQEIYRTIAARDVDGARATMFRHLKRSGERYRTFATARQNRRAGQAGASTRKTLRMA